MRKENSVMKQCMNTICLQLDRRCGETCPGSEWTSRNSCSRHSVSVLCVAATEVCDVDVGIGS